MVSLLFDGHYADTFGEYLAGLVFVERLTGKSVTGNTFFPIGIDADTAKMLHGYAH